ncbi:MAG: S9 family peptidase, partial [Saprospiraceae bacterium]|nr:S9 family peptidase [Saprospiraceae bacterium]
MRKDICILIVTMIWFGCTSAEIGSEQDFTAISVTYPETRSDTILEDYHGNLVPDPYRWLEDDNSEETVDWVSRQNKVSFGYLEQIPYRELLQKRMTEVWNYERYGTPFKRGSRFYFFKNDGLQNQSVLYQQESLDAATSIVLDPNTFSEDGTVSLSGISFNKEGNLLAYQISRGGSDWQTIFVKDLRTGDLFSDSVQWVKFSSMSWYNDGFFYSRFPEPNDDDVLSGSNEFHKLYYHKLGTPQAEDLLIMDDISNPQRNFYGGTTEDERFLSISVVESTSGNALFVKDLSGADASFKQIVERFDHDFDVIDNVGKMLYVMTNYKAPNGRLIAIPADDPDEDNWQEILPEEGSVLRSVQLVGNRLLAHYLIDAKSSVKVYDFKGAFIQDLKLPGIGTVGSFSGKKDDNLAFYTFSSFTIPSTIYKLDLISLDSEMYKEP